MSDDHKDVLIAAYLFEDLAEKDFDAILKLAEDNTITIEGVALVEKDPDGEVHVKETGDHLGRKGLSDGGGVGLVVGLFAPPLLAATVVGAAAGGVLGKFAEHRLTSGIGEKLDAALPPGSGGMTAVYDSSGSDFVGAALVNAVRKSVVTIDGLSASKLKDGLAEAQAGMTGGEWGTRVSVASRHRLWPDVDVDVRGIEPGGGRSQMAFTLGFHIILASVGVAFPALMLIANYRGLRHDDQDALRLARCWSKVVAVTFAVGAVTGTVLSFEFGLLWPAFTGRFGAVFGLLFAIEGLFFFLEAIFIAIYIFGWKRLSPWTHFWAGVPVVIAGLGGAFSVVAVNSWMNQPQGFAPANGDVTSVKPLEVIFNPAVPYEVPHMILAAYLVTGFMVASIYAVGMLRGRRDRIHRLGLLIPLTVACIATPVQFALADSAAS